MAELAKARSNLTFSPTVFIDDRLPSRRHNCKRLKYQAFPSACPSRSGVVLSRSLKPRKAESFIKVENAPKPTTRHVRAVNFSFPGSLENSSSRASGKPITQLAKRLALAILAQGLQTLDKPVQGLIKRTIRRPLRG
jgi:hypothetical protein